MEGSRRAAPFSLRDQFEEQCPVYMSFGMTPEQYWDGDPGLTRWYRKAQTLRNEQANREAWLQGLYIYNAICYASPLFNPYAKRARAKPYPEKPYDLFPQLKSAKEQREEDACTKAAVSFAAWADKFNKRKRGDGK